MKNDEVNKGRLLAFLSYFGILSVLPFLIQPKNKYAVSHGRQGLCIFTWLVIASFLSIMPFLGHFIFLFSVVFCFIFMVVGILNALAGRMWTVPLFGKFFIND